MTLLQYHPRKANVVADALSRKTSRILASLALEDWKRAEVVDNYDLQYYEDHNQAMVYSLIIAPALLQQIKHNQWQDPHLQGIWNQIQNGEQLDDWNVREDGALYFRNHLVVPKVGEIKKVVLDEAHRSQFAIHPGSTKMSEDLKRQYWCRGMKNDVHEYVSECATYLRVKVEHQKPNGELQPLPILGWKWEHLRMEFFMGLPMTEKRHDAIWIVVDRLTKSTHFIPFCTMYSRKVLAELYLEDIVRLDDGLVIKYFGL